MAMAMAGGLRWCKGIVNSFHFNPLQLEDLDTRKLVSQTNGCSLYNLSHHFRTPGSEYAPA